MSSLSTYLDQIGRHQLLDAQQERELARTVQAGIAAQEEIDRGRSTLALKRAVRNGREARKAFILANTRLVVSVAKRYPLPSSMDLEDVIQEGNLGLMHAVEKFDPEKGFKFSTYATFWIRQAIGRALDAQTGIIRIPEDHAARLRAELRRLGGPEGLDSDMAWLHTLRNGASLDQNVGVGEEAGEPLSAFIADDTVDIEEAAIASIHAHEVADTLARLPAQHRRLLELRFGIGDGEARTWVDVGHELGMSGEAARRLGREIMNYLEDDPVMEIA